MTDTTPPVGREEVAVQAERAKIGAIALARFEFPDADPFGDDGGMPLWFSYLGEANAVLAAFATQHPGYKLGWRPIEEAPDQPMGVLLRCPAERHPKVSPGQDYSIQIGFFNGESFHEQGTGHDLRERLESWGGNGDYPTHWQPLADYALIEASPTYGEEG